ncbi:PREDICTED: uncharacterized protein LOC102843826 [Elephantulus edwardii]|uniref:uncharacterized protein LOC102843826 n=1 Tax=Elephantulus edwardii TaxID=28737 RepID=UPI0003F0E93E|nr:PREDICTED: uncharacterized protein LOC102843826 [Elephantulus edwardii]
MGQGTGREGRRGAGEVVAGARPVPARAWGSRARCRLSGRGRPSPGAGGLYGTVPGRPPRGPGAREEGRAGRPRPRPRPARSHWPGLRVTSWGPRGFATNKRDADGRRGGGRATFFGFLYRLLTFRGGGLGGWGRAARGYWKVGWRWITKVYACHLDFLHLFFSLNLPHPLPQKTDKLAKPLLIKHRCERRGAADRFLGTVRLKSTPRPKLSVCVLGDQQHCDEAKAVAIPHMDSEALRTLKKNKKLVKKLARKCDAFLASESLIKPIPIILGPGLNKPGKFPSLLTHNDNMLAKVDKVKSTTKFQMKKVLCLAVAVGRVEMTDDELVYNIHLAFSFLISLLKKNWQNVRALYIQSTMGKSLAPVL